MYLQHLPHIYDLVVFWHLDKVIKDVFEKGTQHFSILCYVLP